MWQPPQFQTIVWCEYCGKKNHARDAGCKNEWLRGVVDDILTTSESWVHFLKQLESAFPHFETDASIRGALEKVQKLKELPTPADVRQLLQKLKSLMIQLMDHNVHKQHWWGRAKLPGTCFRIAMTFSHPMQVRTAQQANPFLHTLHPDRTGQRIMKLSK